MRTTSALLFLVTGLLAACAEDGEATHAESEVQAAPSVPADEAKEIAHRLSACAGNGSSGIRTYDPATFDAAAVMEKLRAADDDDIGQKCGDQRLYSTSRKSGIDLFAKFLDNDADARECVAGALDETQRSKLDAIFRDPTNRGVFASTFDADGENPEGCFYFDFDVYRADGTIVSLSFDFTD